ncbi:ATP-dependent RecD-like DNA helicase [Liquorilactobacillus oeni]|uniref:ATP-dependent RecD2 DNA helicase n=1 Tax=Liquorilactobacillus oeni DSM 19972 TaxID=1423777 RepID=A0A0R1MJI8_9LACO|nr:ATP-dependent RecD-like DNA helicase [Liquorilactobacillus oeni]KRL04651.1 exonuclease V subunit alpha [Liquorilactobacillus oeni DSM 19972]
MTGNEQQDLLLKKQEESFVSGKVDAIFFESPETFYKVIQIKISKQNISWSEEEIVVTGNFAELNENENYRFAGRMIEHPRYGKQFQAFNYQSETPTSKEGLITYLSGESFSGIGQKTAEKIVARLGLNAIEKILKDENCLAGMALSKKQQQTLLEKLHKNNGTQQIIVELNSFGFGSQLASTIFNKYHEKTLSVIHEDPYQLAREIPGIGFKRADQIAEKLGFAADASLRIKAALFQGIYDICQDQGNTYTNTKQLLQQTMLLLTESRRVQLAPQVLAQELVKLADEGKIVGENHRIYLRKYYEAEWRIAQRLENLQADSVELPKNFEKNFNGLLKQVEAQLQISYGKDQITAIKTALCSPVYLLTGGPGTGKTTIINGIVALYAAVHDFSLDFNSYRDETFPIILAAPTGRAAKKMNETTGLPAGTIHRLLGLNGSDEEEEPTESRQLEGKLLIVDEMSMVDTELLELLLEAVPSKMQVILVGDKDQLPSVGPGRTFADLLESNCLPKSQLQTIYRQGRESSIITLAHAVKKGYLPEDLQFNLPDRSFIPCNVSQVEEVIRQVVLKAHARGFSTKDIQVLAPMYRGPAGIDRLNIMMQEILNPKRESQKQLDFGKQSFRIGDKVLHLVNSPEDNVFNGDLGQVVGIAAAKENKERQETLIVDFDGNEVEFKRKDWYKLKLAYCMSIHKSQGSEFKLVILPMVRQYMRMLNRNLLYTAVTRAKDFLILLGEVPAYQTSVVQIAVDRKTTLLERVREVFKQTKQRAEESLESNPVLSKKDDQGSVLKPVVQQRVLTMKLISGGQIDPLIGMANIKPIDFM